MLHATCALLLFLFLYTSINKLLSFQSFRHVLQQSAVTRPFATILAAGIPLVEMVTSVFLFIPRFRKAGLYSSFILLFLFTIYIGLMLAFSSNLPCSCGGVLSFLSWKQHIVFNLFFMLLTGAALFIFNKTGKRSGSPRPSGEAPLY